MADLAAELAQMLAHRFPPGEAIVTEPASWLAAPSDRTMDFQLGWWAALSMVAKTGGHGLTDAEHAIAAKVEDLAQDLMELVGEGPTAGDDWNEILPHLHALQQTVLAQAASRAHPGRYRMLGHTEAVGADDD